MKFPNIKLNKSQSLFLGVFGLVVIALITVNISFNFNSFGKTSVTSVQGPLHISPLTSNISAEGKFTYTSKIITATGPVDVKSTWSITQKASNAELDTDCANSKKSAKCTVISKIKPNSSYAPVETIKIEAKHAKETAETKATLYSFQFSNSNRQKDYILKPGPEVIANQGSKVTITSHKPNATGTSSAPVKSFWFVNTYENDAEIADCDKIQTSTTCSIYTGFKKTKDDQIPIYIFGLNEDDFEVAYSFIKISDRIVLPFNDSIPEWAHESIAALTSRGIIKGYDNGSFGPTDPVTRGQWTTLLLRLSELFKVDTSQVDTSNCSISDTAKDHYAYRAICIGQKLNWLDIPTTETKFRPDDKLTRISAIMMAYNTVLKIWQPQLEKDLKMSISDYQFFSDYKKGDIENTALSVAATLSIIDGFELTTPATGRPSFRPNNNLNRAEAATIIWRIYQEYINPKWGISHQN